MSEVATPKVHERNYYQIGVSRETENELITATTTGSEPFDMRK
jgi:hypothetical protein